MGNGKRRWAWQQGTVGELVAEFLGTFVLISFGTGVVAMSVAALNQSGRGPDAFLASGDWTLIAFGWGFAVTFGIYVAGGVSGAHINPAITLAQALRRNFEWSKVLPYMAAQVLGAFVGAALVYFNYHDAISSLEEAMKLGARSGPDGAATFGIFGTAPAPYFDSWFGPLADQIIGTGFLVMFVFAVTDEFNAPVKANLAPLIIGFIVVAIGMSFGANAGYAINPARDLGPRILAFFAGWGENALPGKSAATGAYFWVPIIGPLIGAAIGAFLYDGLIRNVLLARGAVADPEVVEQGDDVIDDPGRTVTEKKGPENG